ncbi:hypothetical protein F4679DRAFT_526212 [Xylaria curta]|nr:hypothetical protein F4679DRAFT_526212 [Xylaria curta]
MTLIMDYLPKAAIVFLLSSLPRHVFSLREIIMHSESDGPSLSPRMPATQPPRKGDFGVVKMRRHYHNCPRLTGLVEQSGKGPQTPALVGH